MSGVIAKKTVAVASLINWDKNPRYIKDKQSYQNLKQQIKALGDYKPLIVADDEKTVLGGNMRLKAYKELGKKEIDVVVVDAPDDATKIQYMLSDNDAVGSYDKEALQELLIKSDIDVVELEPFSVDFGDPIPILDIVQEVTPPLFDKKNAEHQPKTVECPHCGEEFDV